jgi:uncharacterized protein (TIGR03437 family)
LPPALAGTTASITDSANVTRPASLLMVSPGQLNILTPSGLALGPARLTVTNSTGQSAVSSVSISAVSPGLFAADASGKGPAAANVVNVAADGRQTVSLAADCQGTPLRCATVPIDLGSEGERVFVIFYGTGIRGRSSLDRVAVSVGGTPVEASYAGVQPQFPGLDQINLELPRSLAGRGVTDVRVSVDGLAANTVQIEIR